MRFTKRGATKTHYRTPSRFRMKSFAKHAELKAREIKRKKLSA